MIALFIVVLLKNKTQSESIIQIEFIQPKFEKLKPQKLTSGLGSSQVNDNTHGEDKGGVGKYLPQYNFNSDILSSSTGVDSYLSSPTRDNPNSDWGSGSSTFQRISDYNFYRILYNQVDGTLFYPGILSRQKIKGTVNARIVIASTGDCDWQMTKIHGGDPYLSLYVLDVLKNVCKMNFKKYLGNKVLANADLSFRFDINENNEKDRLDQEKVIVGNTLLFYRNSHHSIAEWELGPFKGMFPIPAVYLNIPWIQENWDRLIHKKEPLDEFKKEFGQG